MKNILLTLIVFGSFGAFADDSLFIDPNNPEPWVQTPENLPKINEETTVYLGDGMLLQRRGYFKTCLQSKINLNAENSDGDKYFVKAGDILCMDRKYNAFFPLPGDENFRDADTFVNSPALSRFRVKRKSITFSILGTKLKKFSKEEFKAAFDPVVSYEIDKKSFQRSLEYAGKNGSILKFIYSEFKDNLARDAFTREFQIDLNEGSTGAYKGAVFEILSADNASVTYKIIRHFPEQ